MKVKLFTVMAAALVGFYSFGASADIDSLPEVQKSGEISYITGGVGDEERSAMESVRKNYNLKVMSSETTGAYIADSKYVIKDKAGNQVLDAMAGPMFFATLPSGSYVLEATNEGRSKKQNFTVGMNKGASLHLSWKP